MPKRWGFLFLVVLMGFIASMLSSCATVPEETSGRVEVKNEKTRVVVVFSEGDSHLIRGYYRKHLKKLPPGLAKRKRLPPGLEKQVVKNGTLPPGLSWKPLPAQLEENLTPLPAGYIRIRVGTDVILLDDRTRVVMDILYDVTD